MSMLPIIPAIMTTLWPQIRTLSAPRKTTRVFIECLLGRTVFAGWGFRLFLRSPRAERPASDMQNPLTLTAALTSSCAPWNNVTLYAASRTITISGL
jgi:hypothetical protein